jgi:hypothetical protein
MHFCLKQERFSPEMNKRSVNARFYQVGMLKNIFRPWEWEKNDRRHGAEMRPRFLNQPDL